MGWKGVIRSVVAASRAAEREQDRRNRQYQKHLAAATKQQAIEDAVAAVREYDDYVAAVQGLHKTCSEKINWLQKVARKLPPPPRQEKNHEESARARLGAYNPPFLDRMLKRVEKKKTALRQDVEKSAQIDHAEYDRARKSYVALIEEIESERELASLLLNGDAEASLDLIR